jgi:hypothetical protein
MKRFTRAAAVAVATDGLAIALVGYLLLPVHSGKPMAKLALGVLLSLAVLLLWSFCLSFRIAEQRARREGNASFRCWRATWALGQPTHPLRLLMAVTLVLGAVALVVAATLQFGIGGPFIGVGVALLAVLLVDLLISS